MQLKAEDGTIHHLAAPLTAPVFRAFNSYFVPENPRFEFGGATRQPSAPARMRGDGETAMLAGWRER